MMKAKSRWPCVMLCEVLGMLTDHRGSSSIIMNGGQHAPTEFCVEGVAVLFLNNKKEESNWRTSRRIWDPRSFRFRPEKSRFSQGNLAFSALNRNWETRRC
jgi:hypothetical protein